MRESRGGGSDPLLSGLVRVADRDEISKSSTSTRRGVWCARVIGCRRDLFGVRREARAAAWLSAAATVAGRRGVHLL